MNPSNITAPLFNRRKEEWNRENVKKYIDLIFNSVNLLGWTFIGSEWIDVSGTPKKEDLKKSIYSILRVKVKDPENREYDYSLQIPDLYYNQFFFIGGFLKVPIFQLYDLPIIYRAAPSGAILKLRTNSISITVDLNRKDEIPFVNLFNRDVPLHTLLACSHTRDELVEFQEAHPDENDILSKIYSAAETEWEKNRSQEEIYNCLGEYFMNQPSEKTKKGESTLFSLNAAYCVDPFSKKYFHTSSLIFEILHAIYEGPRNDTDLKYKRIRLAEYILSPLIHKVYDMLITLHKHHKDRFQIPQNIILENCNASDSKDGKNSVSNIIHYNNPINPIGEIASFLQCTLVGPGGFKKDNVPPHLRNMDESQFGIVCAADTPDREGCGVIQNMIPTITLDELGQFGEINEESVVSFPISLVPFLEKDDSTRLQMASNQIKQTIMLKKSEPAWIRSGNESLFLNESTFQHIAKEDGFVLHTDPSFMIVVYDRVIPKKVDIFQIKYRSLYLNTIDYINPNFKISQRFNKGDVLCQSNFIKNGEACLGRNLLTAIAVWKGFNYEDGVVIAESVVEKMASLHSVDLSFNVESGQVLLSLKDDEYYPLPNIGDQFQKGDTYAKIKNLDWENGFDNINEEPIEQKASSKCQIISREIYPNAWNHHVNEFHVSIKQMISEQLVRYNLVVNALSDYMSKDEIDKFLMMHGLSSLNCDQKHIGKFYNKGQKIGGVMIKLKGLYEECIGCGDKVANRHGNKGVIARVVPDDQMPLLQDGRRVEIIINPLGIVSRINAGQILELHLGEAIYQLRKKMLKLNNFEKAKTILSRFLDILDNTNGNWAKKKILSDFENDVEKHGLEKAIGRVYAIMPPFKSSSASQIKTAMKLVGAEEKMFLTDTETGEVIKNPISCGYMYFHKLVHRASDKISARSIGPYNKKTSQPMGGKSNQGGHRLGEMEVWALFAHNASTFLKDMLTVHSDSIGKKNKILSQILQNPSLIEGDEQDERPQTLRIMEAYFNIVGLYIDMQDGRLPDIMTQDKLEQEELLPNEKPLEHTIGEHA